MAEKQITLTIRADAAVLYRAAASARYEASKMFERDSHAVQLQIDARKLILLARKIEEVLDEA